MASATTIKMRCVNCPKVMTVPNDVQSVQCSDCVQAEILGIRRAYADLTAPGSREMSAQDRSGSILSKPLESLDRDESARLRIKPKPVRSDFDKRWAKYLR